MSDARHTIEPFFLPFGQEALFCLFTAPMDKKPRGAVLYLPPFAEEMHKSRRMAALQARALAEAGYAVLRIDLLGCGDSTADFGQASWEAWLSCAQVAHGWLKSKLDTPVALWGLRLGAALAVELAARLPETVGLVLWQPVINGELFLNQFLRIKVAGEMFANPPRTLGIKDLRGQLAAGEAVEVAGHMLSPALAAGIDKLRLGQAPPRAPVYWLEVAPNPSDALPPASAQVVKAWRESGTEVFPQMLAGEPFWATQEIFECPSLLPETTKALENIAP